MKIEFLYPEICYLYGDIGNVEYLKASTKAKIIRTPLNDIPYFVNHDVSLIYLGSMTEKGQEKVIEKLKPYQERIQELINNGTVFLLTGNSFEVFGQYIEDEKGKKIKGLEIFDTYSKRFIPTRFNSLFLGEFNNKAIVGYISRFSHTYGDTDKYLFKVTKGFGINEESHYEGIHIHNVFATYLLGPLLIENPYFTEYLLKLMKVKNPKIAFPKEAIKAYETRVNEFKQEIEFGGH